ncbi:MFS transporter [Cohnella algarum]|uniref:MFS transporter n=1 Tax=Cohnella algarum TaxID=2044859 RepID=UPI0019676F56|nr:MFS transporter [Cohnella algarum]
MSQVVGLWNIRGFRKYYLLSILSYFGSGISVVAMPYAIYEKTLSPIYTSLASVMTSLPYLLFGLLAGALADRGNRKRIMIGCDLFSAAALASVPLAAAVLGEVSALHLLAVALAASTAFVGFDSASHGALLQLVGRERLVAANSALIAADAVIRIASPVAAGILISSFGAEWAIAATACCYLTAAGLVHSIKGPFQSVRQPAGAKPAAGAERPAPPLRRLREDIAIGLSYIWSQPLIRSLTLVGFGNSFVGEPPPG